MRWSRRRHHRQRKQQRKNLAVLVQASKSGDLPSLCAARTIANRVPVAVLARMWGANEVSDLCLSREMREHLHEYVNARVEARHAQRA